MAVRGVRGATTVQENSKAAIAEATKEVLREITVRNDVAVDDIASIIFTVTADLDAEFPAIAAREMGMGNVALLCAREIPVRNSLPQCIRVLMHINTEKKQDEIAHIYLREATKLRPDLT